MKCEHIRRGWSIRDNPGENTAQTSGPVQYVCLFIIEYFCSQSSLCCELGLYILHISLHIVGRDDLLKGVNKMNGVGWKLLILF